MTDYKNYRAPRWYDTLQEWVVDLAPVWIICMLIIGIVFDHYRVGA